MTETDHVDSCNRRYGIYQEYFSNNLTTPQFQKLFMRNWLAFRLLKNARRQLGIEIEEE